MELSNRAEPEKWKKLMCFQFTSIEFFSSTDLIKLNPFLYHDRIRHVDEVIVRQPYFGIAPWTTSANDMVWTIWVSMI